MSCAKKDRVLLIDSHPEELKRNRDYLRENGYEVDIAATVQQGVRLLEKYGSACVVMDAVFPEMENFEGFRVIRRRTGVPILLLTEHGREKERIKGLTLGAQDYIVKPCSPQELSLRIMIHLCRQTPSPDVGVLEFGSLRIERMNRRVICGGKELALSNRELELLVFLAKNPGEVVTFEQIGEALYGTYLESDRKNIMVCASRLRKKLESCENADRLIETVWGTGYRFRP